MLYENIILNARDQMYIIIFMLSGMFVLKSHLPLIYYQHNTLHVFCFCICFCS